MVTELHLFNIWWMNDPKKVAEIPFHMFGKGMAYYDDDNIMAIRPEATTCLHHISIDCKKTTWSLSRESIVPLSSSSFCLSLPSSPRTAKKPPWHYYENVALADILFTRRVLARPSGV